MASCSWGPPYARPAVKSRRGLRFSISKKLERKRKKEHPQQPVGRETFHGRGFRCRVFPRRLRGHTIPPRRLPPTPPSTLPFLDPSTPDFFFLPFPSLLFSSLPFSSLPFPSLASTDGGCVAPATATRQVFQISKFSNFIFSVTRYKVKRRVWPSDGGGRQHACAVVPRHRARQRRFP